MNAPLMLTFDAKEEVVAEILIGPNAPALAKGPMSLMHGASSGVTALRMTKGQLCLRGGLVVRPARRGPRARVGEINGSSAVRLGAPITFLALLIARLM